MRPWSGDHLGSKNDEQIQTMWNCALELKKFSKKGKKNEVIFQMY